LPTILSETTTKANANGKMNAAQIGKLLDEAAKEFDKLDLNGDGSVSREEL